MTDKRTKGFVTVATGSETYYKMAYNLVRSYRLFNHELPFAIVCDRINRYTDSFDDVLLLEDARCNYTDKLSLLKNAPYDENFFIESDCIIYRNIEGFFGLFSESTDFSCFGWNGDKLTKWFADPDVVIRKFGPLVSSIPNFNPGYFYIRLSEVCQKMYDDAVAVGDWILKNDIKGGKTSLISKGSLRDDPLLAVAMQLNACECAAKPSVGKCISLPSVKKTVRISLSDGALDVIQTKEYNDCSLLHFSARRCREDGLYLQQVIVLDMIHARFPRTLVKVMESKIAYGVFHIVRRIKYAVIHRLRGE